MPVPHFVSGNGLNFKCEESSYFLDRMRHHFCRVHLPETNKSVNSVSPTASPEFRFIAKGEVHVCGLAIFLTLGCQRGSRGVPTSGSVGEMENGGALDPRSGN